MEGTIGDKPVKLAILCVLSTLGATFYRMGGSDTYNTKWRDLGCPTVATALLWAWGGWNWWLILCFGLFFGSLTTYWKKKGTDAKWWNWMLVGLGFSLAYLPYTIATGNWVGFALRTLIVTVGVTIWSEKISDAVMEELGRGFIAIVTLPILC